MNRFRARTQPRRDGSMNKLEAKYAGVLELRKKAGEISAYWFEGLKLRLADRTFYTPDFVVQLADGSLELHETKGHWEEDARIKVKVAAAQYPFRFVALTWSKAGGWKEEEF